MLKIEAIQDHSSTYRNVIPGFRRIEKSRKIKILRLWLICPLVILGKSMGTTNNKETRGKRITTTVKADLLSGITGLKKIGFWRSVVEPTKIRTLILDQQNART